MRNALLAASFFVAVFSAFWIAGQSNLIGDGSLGLNHNIYELVKLAIGVVTTALLEAMALLHITRPEWMQPPPKE